MSGWGFVISMLEVWIFMMMYVSRLESMLEFIWKLEYVFRVFLNLLINIGLRLIKVC